MGSVCMGAKNWNTGYVASMNCLPDELLIQILSFLPTKQAASTSVLSKRWRTLFAFRHDLDFDDSIFWHPEEGKRDMHDTQDSFRSFVDRTLAFQNGAPINKFSLKCGNGYEEVHVDRWISIALTCGVIYELCLSLEDILSYDFPHKIFTSTTLVKLSLGTEQYIRKLPHDISLPALKVLILDSIWFKGNQLSDVFLPACPVLEDLTINQKSFVSDVIFSKTIKRLSIFYDCDDDYYFYSTTGVLHTPNVVDLYYSNYARRWSPRCNFDSLAKATLDLHFIDIEEKLDADVTDLINGIRNVKTLHLTSSSIEVISVCCKGGLPVFENLIDLVLFCNREQGWEVLLPLLIEHSPNLKTLVLSGMSCYTYIHRFGRIRIPPNNQIEMMSILQYRGSAYELERISHFLLKMECLQVVKVCVTPDMDDYKKMEITKELLKLPTASSKLKIQVM